MRRRYITNLGFQSSFTFTFIWGSLAAIGIPAAVRLFSLYALAQQPLLSPEQKSALLAGFNQQAMIFLWMALATALAFGALGAYLSFRFAGPMARLEGWLTQKLDEQDPGPLRLRPGDELGPVADLLSRLSQKRR